MSTAACCQLLLCRRSYICLRCLFISTVKHTAYDFRAVTAEFLLQKRSFVSDDSSFVICYAVCMLPLYDKEQLGQFSKLLFLCSTEESKWWVWVKYSVPQEVFSSVSRLLGQLDETEAAFDDFWDKHQAKLEQCLQLRHFEQNFREVRCTDWCMFNIC